MDEVEEYVAKEKERQQKLQAIEDERKAQEEARKRERDRAGEKRTNWRWWGFDIGNLIMKCWRYWTFVLSLILLFCRETGVNPVRARRRKCENQLILPNAADKGNVIGRYPRRRINKAQSRNICKTEALG